jgi:toxin HigB-1
MIKSFKSRALKRLFEEDDSRKLPQDMLTKIENILVVLNRASEPDDMDLPGFKLHPLKGARSGQWAVTVRANWRIVFRFEGGNAADVDFVDYH